MPTEQISNIEMMPVCASAIALGIMFSIIAGKVTDWDIARNNLVGTNEAHMYKRRVMGASSFLGGAIGMAISLNG